MFIYVYAANIVPFDAKSNTTRIQAWFNITSHSETDFSACN